MMIWINRVGWLSLVVALLAACAPAAPPDPLPLANNRPTFIYFYTDG